MSAQSFGKKRRRLNPTQADEILLLGEFDFQWVRLAGFDQHAFRGPKRRELVAHILQSHAETGRGKVQQRNLLGLHISSDFLEQAQQRRDSQEKNLVKLVRQTATSVEQKWHSLLTRGPFLQFRVNA